MPIQVDCAKNPTVKWCPFEEYIINTIKTLNHLTQITQNKNYFDTTIENVKGGIPVFDFTQTDEIINSSSDKIIIDMHRESYHVFDYDMLYKKLDKNKTYYLWTNGFWQNKQNNIKLLPWTSFLFDYAHYHTFHQSLQFWQDTNYYFSTPKKFIFCATIGAKKHWRDLLTQQLLSDLKFDNFILNYNGEELKEKSRHYDINYNFSNINDSYKFNNYSKISDGYHLFNSLPIEMYNVSNLLLIVETNAYNFEEFHLTEKTLKALLTGIPFIVISSYKFLHNLRNLGFRTYNELWSEDYDDIPDLEQRTDTIINLLNNFNLDIFKNQQEKLLEIRNHNRSNLFNVNNLMKQQLSNTLKVLS